MVWEWRHDTAGVWRSEGNSVKSVLILSLSLPLCLPPSFPASLLPPSFPPFSPSLPLCEFWELNSG